MEPAGQAKLRIPSWKLGYITFILSVHGSGLASRMATKMKNEENPTRTVEQLISDHIENDDEYLRFKVRHDSPCSGLEVHGYAPEDDPETCEAIGCDNDTSDAWVKIGSCKTPTLCDRHLLAWIEHEASIECKQCAAWFETLEAEE